MAFSYGAAEPSLEFAFKVEAELDPPLELGTIGGLRKRIIPIKGGKVSGPKLNGTVVPGGADWQTLRPDNVADIYARYTLKSDDGVLITVENPGVRHGPDEVMQKLIAGERVDPSTYYFRTTPRLEAPDGAYAWMGRSVWVCQGVRWPDSVEIRFYAVL
jgi:hypothetical protein